MKRIISRILDYLFGFKECNNCYRFEMCDKKPYLHSEKECKYNVIHNRNN